MCSMSDICSSFAMGLLPDTQNCDLRMCRKCREPFPRHRLQRKPLVSDPGMHHDTCVTHVSWCMSGSLTSGGGEKVPGIPGACATRNITYLVRGALSSCMQYSVILDHGLSGIVNIIHAHTPACIRIHIFKQKVKGFFSLFTFYSTACSD